MKYLIIVVEFLFVLSIALWMIRVLNRTSHMPILQPDEAAWVYSGYYFNLYFLQFNLFHKDWGDYDAFDHPPLVKYITGGTVYLKGYRIDSLDAKRLWRTIPINKFHIYYDRWVDKTLQNLLPVTRFVMFLFSFSSLMLSYRLVKEFYGFYPAALSTFLLASNSIFFEHAALTLSEPVLLFFFVLFVSTCARYLRSGNSLYVVLGFVISSLAFLTKLNGLALLFIMFIIILFKKKLSITRHDASQVGLGLLIFILVNLLLNPVFLNSGIQALWRMFEQRLEMVHLQQEVFTNAALYSMGQEFCAAVGILFFKYSLSQRLFNFPLELVLFLLGTYYSFRKRDPLLITILLFFVALPILTLPLNWNRYYFTILPFVYIITGVSLNMFQTVVSGYSRARRAGAQTS